MPRDLDYMRRAFEHFVEVCQAQSPLYAAISAACAKDDDVLKMAMGSQSGQPVVNILLASVHFLLLGGADHALRSFYPSVGGRQSPEDVWPAFRDFCDVYRDEILQMVPARRVQTNVVGRCGCLLPAFSLLDRDAGRPLALIELGASAGLNLNFDRYRYTYAMPWMLTPRPSASESQAAPASAQDPRMGEGNEVHVGSNSAVHIRVDVRGRPSSSFWLGMPEVHLRMGLDIEPQDVTDDEAMRWIESLIWPDELDRIERFRSAVAIARLHPPTILKGDGLNLLPAVVDRLDRDDVLPCVYHSHAIYQMKASWHDRFERTLNEIGSRRDFAHVSLEWLHDDPGPMLHVTTWLDGTPNRRRLAACHHHGRWMEWTSDEGR